MSEKAVEILSDHCNDLKTIEFQKQLRGHSRK